MRRLYLLAFLSLASEQVHALSLFDAFQKAVGYDAGYAAASESLLATQEQPIQAAAQLYPNVSLSARKISESYSYNKGLSSYSESSSSQYLQLSQPVYNARLWRSVDVADRRLQAAQLRTNLALQDLMLRVTDAYLSVLTYQENVLLSEQQVKTTETRLEQVIAAMNVGYASTVDVYGLQAELDDMRSRQMLDEQQLAVSRKKLTILTGDELPPILTMPKLDSDSILKHFVADKTVFHEGKDHNLSVKLKEAEVEIAQSDLSVRQAEHYPTVSFGGNYSNTQGTNYAAQKFDDRVMYLEVSVPLYQGGYLDSRVREGQANLRTVQKETEFARRDAAKKIQEQLSALQTASERLKAIDKAIASGGVYLESVEEGFRLGLRDITEVSRAKERLFSNRRDKIKTTVEFINSLISLHATAGRMDDKLVQQVSEICWKSS